MISADELRGRVEKAIPGASAEVTTDGYAYHFRVVSELFDGKRAVTRQQLVYSGLNDLISDGSLHALTIETYTPGEAGETP
mgnify:CR=1 FL=1